MAVSSGFQVAPVRSAPLAMALPPVQTGQIDSGAFKVDLATPYVQGIAAGTALVKPLADTVLEFSPEKQGERALKMAQLKLANEMIGPESQVALAELKLKQSMAGNTLQALENYRGGAARPLSGVNPDVEAPAASTPGPLANVGGGFERAPGVTDEDLQLTPAPLANAQAPQAKALETPSNSGGDRQAILQQELDRMNNLAYLPMIPAAKNELANLLEINKQFADSKLGDPMQHTMAEKLEMLRQSSPMAVEGRKVQNAEAQDFIKNKEVQDYHIALGSLKGMEELQKVWKPGTPDAAANDFTLTYRFMRTIDPMMGVRESQQEAAQHIGSLPQKWQGLASKVMNGGTLTKEQRDGMIKAAGLAIKGSRAGYETMHAGARKRIALSGGDPDALDELASEHIAANTGLVNAAGDEIAGSQNVPIMPGTRSQTSTGNKVTVLRQ